ncbi:MAG: bifunctional ADP-dependent NAD(P)H-hydrate dehydratase/NAD(P)H-hydrate epimerase [Anaerolinea sp.]|nr:bifunctional ADP-dependent NAD(P)H-hydrate dehydratase/NAD(P)H-hydrate epimerase [Anaerolinea sp.]
MKLVTTAEMRALEAAAVAAGTSEAQLMEEAGLAVAQEAWMLLGTLEGRRIVVLAGPGNNGGDGLVAARHLSDWGTEVVVYAPLGRPEDGNAAELANRDVTMVDGRQDSDPGALEQLLGSADLVVDALLGIGQTRPLEPGSPMAGALEKLAGARRGFNPPKVVAVDVPTGINADSGVVDPFTVEPDLTVTFGLPKVGMYQSPASALVGRVQVIDIGIPKAAQDAVQLELLTARWARQALPKRAEDANKGTFGKVLVVGGSRSYVGAPRLAASGAYRAGAGLVSIACPDTLIPMLAPAIAEATWLPQVTTTDGTLPGEAAITLRAGLHGYSTVVFGPGLSLTDETRALTWALMPDFGIELTRGCVIDADALNALAGMDGAAERIPANAVLTPHPGEMARLLKTTVADVQSRRLEIAREAAAKFGCTILLKGAHSIIAGANGKTALSPFSNPLLATAGSGDVLAGMIGGYLAQGLEPFEAACLGVYLHGATGEALRLEMGEAGLLAGEIADRLPRVVKDVAAL